MDDQLIRTFLDSPKRVPVVIIATCSVALLTIWPAVDEYVALNDHRAQLVQSLAHAKQEVSEYGRLQRRAAQRAGELAEIKRRAVSGRQLHSFRTELVEMARSSGCRVRRIDLEPPVYQPWRPGSRRPQESSLSLAHDHDDEAPYRLRSQTLSLAVAGPLNNVNSLLRQLEVANRLIHAKQLSLRPADEKRTEVVLELQIQLFDLEVLNSPQAA